MSSTPLLSENFNVGQPGKTNRKEYYNTLMGFLDDALERAQNGTLSRRQHNADLAMQLAHEILYTYFDPQHPEKTDGFRPNIDPVAFADEVIGRLRQVRPDPQYSGREHVEAYIRMLEEEKKHILCGGTEVVERDRHGLPFVNGPDQQWEAFTAVKPPNWKPAGP